MEIQEVEIFIAHDGKISYEVRGIKGRKCLDLTREFENDLGDDIISRKETWEMGHEGVLHETDLHLTTKE